MKEAERKESIKGQRESQKEYVAMNKKLKSLKTVVWILLRVQKWHGTSRVLEWESRY